MSKIKIILIMILLAVVVSLVTACQPPPLNITVVVINAPEDLRISLTAVHIIDDVESERQVRPGVINRLWETNYCFIFDYWEPLPKGWPNEDAIISVSSERHGEFEVYFPWNSSRDRK